MTTKKQNLKKIEKPYQDVLRRNLMFSFYCDYNNKETFSNATQSALKAGYSFSHADRITTEDWFKKRLDNFQELEATAEEYLKTVMEYKDIEITKKEDGRVVESLNMKLVKVKSDNAIFLLETLANSRYKKKSEIMMEEHNSLQRNDAINKLFYSTKES